MIRSMSCGSGRPVAAHILGKPDAGVIPGIVLISFTRTRPPGVQKKSTRARPSQEIASNAAQASRCTSAVAGSGMGAGMIMLVPSARYFASKS